MSPLLNYTTKIEAIKTVGEIQGILAAHGARAILIEYGQDGLVEALSFKAETPHGEIGFRLPVDHNATLKTLSRQRLPTRIKLDKHQAIRVAWHIVKDWVSAQMAIIETEMVKMEQIFLPYAITPSGRTLYEVMADRNFLLPEGKKDHD